MTVTRSYSCPKAGRAPLVLHGYVDDGVAGGEIVLTAEQVAKDETPTKAGIVEAANTRWVILSLKNRGGVDIIWTTIPEVRTTNEYNVDGPAYDHGAALLANCKTGNFSTTLAAGAEDLIEIDTRLTGWGILLQAEAPGQTLDLLTTIFSTRLAGTG